MHLFQPALELCILAMLLYAGWTDIVSRLIPNSICIGIALVGAAAQTLAGPMALLEAIAAGSLILLILWPLFAFGIMGGGDVKLLTALAIAIGLSFHGIIALFAITALAGGVLVLIHAIARHMPRPHRYPGASLLRRVYTIERWRILRRAPLPYGVAIACGGIWALLTTTGV